MENDPHELNNLAFDPAYREVVNEHEQQMIEWLIEAEREAKNFSKDAR